MSISNYPDSTHLTAVTITAGQTASENIDLHGTRLCGLAVNNTPSAMTVRFEVSLDGSSWLPVYNEQGARFEVSVLQVGAYLIWPTRFAGIRHIRVTIDAAEASDVSLTIISRPL